MDVGPTRAAIPAQLLVARAVRNVQVGDQATAEQEDPDQDQAPVKRTRHPFPMSQKCEVIRWVLGPGEGLPIRAVKYFQQQGWQIDQTTIRKWWHHRESIMDRSSGNRVFVIRMAP